MTKCGIVHLSLRVISCVNAAIQFYNWDSWQDDIYFSQTNIPFYGDEFSFIHHVVEHLKELIAAPVQTFKWIYEVFVVSLVHAFCWISEILVVSL